MYGYEILHSEIMENLIKNVRGGISQHAYIFEGKEGVGSLEAAKLFANTLVCKDTDRAPCTLCTACLLAEAGNHPDIYYIAPPKDKKNITVDVIRTVCADAYTKPYESKNKVYIITYGDDMNEQAQNALLKLLEEPPEYAVFIILAENSETLLETIRSRCTLIRFAPISEEKLKKHLLQKFPESTENIDFLVKYSGGVLGNAEKLLVQDDFIPMRDLALEHLPQLLSQNPLDAFSIASFVEENKDSADTILLFWQKLVRDIMLIQNDARDIILNADVIDKLINLSGKYDEKKIVLASEKILLAQKMRKRYVSLRTLILALAFSIKQG